MMLDELKAEAEETHGTYGTYSACAETMLYACAGGWMSLTTSMICCNEIPKLTSSDSFSFLTGREYLLYFSKRSIISRSSLGPCFDSAG